MAAKPNKQDIDKAQRALEVLLATRYVSKRVLYKENFLRGLFFGVGTIIGTAIMVTILLWLLSLVETLPFIGPISENIEQSVESSAK